MHKDSINTANEADELITGSIIKYSDVSDGQVKITAIQSPTTVSGTEKLVYDKDTKQFDGKVAASNGVLFVNKGGDFYVYTIRNLNDITVDVGDSYTAMLDDNKVIAAYAQLDSKPSGATTDTVYGIVSSENGTVSQDGDTYTSYTVQVDDNRENDRTILIAGDDTSLKEGYLVGFDVSSDDVYSASDITIYLKNENTDIKKPSTMAAVKEYDEDGQIISYWDKTDDIGVDNKLVTKAVDDDVQIIFVDTDEDVAAATSGN